MTFSSRVTQVTKTVESPRVIGLEARINVESNEISHFYVFFSYKIVPEYQK